MNSTPKHLIAVVVYTLAMMSVLFLSTLCYCVIKAITIDPVFLPIGSGIIGAFTGMLINTRSSSVDATTASTVTVTREEQTPPPIP